MSLGSLVNPAYMASGGGSKLENYHPPTNFETFRDGIPLANAQSFSNEDGLKSNVINWIAKYLGIDPSNVEWTSGSSMDGGFSTGYVRQAYNGIPFANAVANVAFVGDKVTSFGNSFVSIDQSKIAPSTPTKTPADAIACAEVRFGGKHNGTEPVLQYLARPDGSVSLVYSVQVQKEDTGAFLEVYVDAHSGEVLSMTDFVAH
ncbi:hypothetical protein E1B28_008111 [Marasmius oreades]|uniref:PepSY domain-containing protein n=1 Tax=Marasmius oreades TaxID=181124 RepID=A0A9P7RXV4_9AGAR|nr:uncharacterized protein E1B28_008111 [Marasmius oreades]KAG7091709.1 hypothetical protein E1B28_008111 [Marasmius oreades]